MILTHLVLFSFFNGAGGSIVVVSGTGSPFVELGAVGSAGFLLDTLGTPTMDLLGMPSTLALTEAHMTLDPTTLAGPSHTATLEVIV